MGMGDSKKPYEPVHGKVLDVVLNLQFADCAVRECPHPGVIKRYGTGGIATVSIYTCKKCKFSEKAQWYGGWRCGYGMGLSPGEKGESDRPDTDYTRHGEHG